MTIDITKTVSIGKCNLGTGTWKKVIRLDPCGYCNESGGTVDHIVPIIRMNKNNEKGLHMVLWNGENANSWMNMGGACERCNNKAKGRMGLLQFLVGRSKVSPKVDILTINGAIDDTARGGDSGQNFPPYGVEVMRWVRPGRILRKVSGFLGWLFQSPRSL